MKSTRKILTPNKSKKYTVAIIGAGWCGMGSQLDELRVKPASHAEAVSTNKRTELIAFVDTNPASLALARRLYPKVERFESAEEMFARHQPDIIVIATQPDTHCRYIELCSAKKAKAILCEKPISHDFKEAEQAIATAKKYNVVLLVNHTCRFDPLVRRFREYVAGSYVRDTFLGKVHSATAYYNKGLYHGGTHHIDLLQFYLGKVRWVSAVECPNEKADNGDVAVDAFLEFENGVVASLQYFNSLYYVLFETSFFGEKGRLNLIDSAGSIIEVIGTRSYKNVSAYRELDYENKKVFGDTKSYHKSILPHVIDCLEGKDTPVSTGEDALKTLEVIKAIEKSARFLGKKIEI